MKKVKLIIFSALVTAITFYSVSTNTYGAFTGKAESKPNMFQSGTLKVLLNAGNAKSLSLDYGKLGAGDSISKVLLIKNSGSLPFISKISMSNKGSPIFDYLLCEIKLHYEEGTGSDRNDCNYILYSGEFNKLITPLPIKYQKDDISKAISELVPDETLKCEMILTLPEDVILPEDAIRLNNTNDSTYNSEKCIDIKIDTTQVNNT
jgi:hypothetical protein